MGLAADIYGTNESATAASVSNSNAPDENTLKAVRSRARKLKMTQEGLEEWINNQEEISSSGVPFEDLDKPQMAKVLKGLIALEAAGSTVSVNGKA